MIRDETTSAWPRERVLPAALIVLLTIVAYMPVITSGGFIWDDDHYVHENPLLREEGGLRRIWIPDDPIQSRSEDAQTLQFVPFWFRPETPQYYPMVFTTFWLEWRLWGDEARGYHVLNVLLHAANAVLLFLLMIRLEIPGGLLAAWLIGALFALHPVHVESVAWITERKNTLSLLFYLFAAGAYLRFDRMRFEDEPGVHREGDVWGWYALALLLFVFALLSKSVTCSLPAALILVMVWLRVPLSLKRLAPLAPFFIIGFVLAMNTALIERELVGASGSEFQFTFIERTLIATHALLFYPLKMLWPHPLMFIYPRWEIDPASPAQYLPLLIALIVGTIVLWLLARGVRGPFVALSFYAGTVFPALGYFNVYPHIFSFVADHFVYHASIGFIVFIVGGAAFLLRKRTESADAWMLALACPTLLVFAGLTWRQSGVYESEESVYRHTIARNPAAWMPHNNLSTILVAQAEQAWQAGDLQTKRALIVEAKGHAEAALAVRPTNHPSHANRAEALRLLGEYEEALLSIRRAKELEPVFIEYSWQEGRLLHLLGRYEEALEAHRDAVARAPHVPTFRSDYAETLLALARWDDAAEQLEALREIRPKHFQTTMRLAAVRYQQERFAEAEGLLREAVEIAQTVEAQFRAVTQLVRLLATAPDPEVRDFDEAMLLAERLAQATSYQDPAVLGVLASVHAEAGETHRAIAIAQQAIDLARHHGLTDVEALLAEELARYKARE